MKQNEDKVLSWILESEGGFAQRPEEPGGSVNMGITLNTLTDWRVGNKKPRPTIEDLKNLTKEECHAIYRELFFHPVRFDDLPSGVDYCVVDAAVHSGVAGSIRFLQEALGYKYQKEYPGWKGKFVTGKLDADTIWATLHHNPKDLIYKLIDVRRARQRQMLTRKQHNLPGFNRTLWEKGWTNRNHKALQRSLELLEKK
jgi:lysozyme family protein